MLRVASIAVLLSASTACAQQPTQTDAKPTEFKPRLMKTNADWKKELSPEQYRVLREKGTERPFTGALLNNHQQGAYKCAACGETLFKSETKFDSGTGWPSFHSPATPNAVAELSDQSHGMTRTEVVCANCGGHLGHVFDDGPQPTGLRYCINSVSLKFDGSK